MNDAFGVIRAVLGVLIAALLIWLVVRLFNQREKRGRKICISAAVLYFVGIGPMARVAQELDAEWIMYPYLPMVLLAHEFRPVGDVLLFYVALCGVRID